MQLGVLLSGCVSMSTLVPWLTLTSVWLEGKCGVSTRLLCPFSYTILYPTLVTTYGHGVCRNTVDQVVGILLCGCCRV